MLKTNKYLIFKLKVIISLINRWYYRKLMQNKNYFNHNSIETNAILLKTNYKQI